jgi:hypothetical protein
MEQGLVDLRKVTATNREVVLALSVLPEQRPLVGTVRGALSEAADHSQANPWYRAIYVGEEPVGFVMISWNLRAATAGDHRALVSVEAADRPPVSRPGLRH